MTTPLETPDFFALEAGETLDRLEQLASAERTPPPEEFFRATRVLRGSALLAGQRGIARAAASLEALARGLRDGTVTWTDRLATAVRHTLEEFRFLVGRARGWTEDESTRAARLARTLDDLAGAVAVDAPGSPSRPDLHPGVRAFAARECALIASALDRAAQALRSAPADHEPLYAVIRRMQSLRGLAELGELTPLPEILDGIELAIGDLTRMFAPPPGVEEVIGAAAQALTRIARDTAEVGRPAADAAEARRFTDLLLRAFAVERDVVPIESLYYDEDPEPAKAPIAEPRFGGPEALGPLELVSHGEHLCQTADVIARARSAVERDLRLYHLLGTLRAVRPAGSDPVAAGLAVFARSTREALAAGAASGTPEELAACLRHAGEFLRGAADPHDRMLISRRLLDLAYRLDQIRPALPGGPTDAPADEAVPIGALLLTQEAPAPAPDELPVVPIESLALDEPASALDQLPVVPVESLAPDAPSSAPPAPAGEPAAAAAWAGGLERSFATYGRLLRERGEGAVSLDLLLGRSSASGASPPAGADPAAEAVAIETLCYRGRAALERAAALRQRIAHELAREADLARVRPLLEELLDLVPLALVES